MAEVDANVDGYGYGGWLLAGTVAVCVCVSSVQVVSTELLLADTAGEEDATGEVAEVVTAGAKEVAGADAV